MNSTAASQPVLAEYDYAAAVVITLPAGTQPTACHAACRALCERNGYGHSRLHKHRSRRRGVCVCCPFCRNGRGTRQHPPLRPWNSAVDARELEEVAHESVTACRSIRSAMRASSAAAVVFDHCRQLFQQTGCLANQRSYILIHQERLVQHVRRC